MKQIIFILLATVLVCVNCAGKSPSDKKDDTCPNNDCNCSEDLNFDEMGPEETVCAKLPYLPEDANGKTVSAKDIPPICFDVPVTNKIKIKLCLELYDLRLNETQFHACVKVKISWSFLHLTIKLKCLEVPITEELLALIANPPKNLEDELPDCEWESDDIPFTGDRSDYPCSNNECHCDKYIDFNKMGPNETVCAKLSYLSANIEDYTTLIGNNYAIDIQTVSARDPAPMCFNVKLWKLGKARMCLVFYDLTFHMRKFHGCLKLTVDIKNSHHVMDLKCINVEVPKQLLETIMKESGKAPAPDYSSPPAIYACFNDDCNCTKFLTLKEIGPNDEECTKLSGLLSTTSTLHTFTDIIPDPDDVPLLPEVCIPIPISRNVKVQLCTETYDYSFRPPKMHGCVKVKINAIPLAKKEIKLGCFDVPVRKIWLVSSPVEDSKDDLSWADIDTSLTLNDVEGQQVCRCKHTECHCCLDVGIEEIEIHGKLCIKVAYLPVSLSVSAALSWNDIELINKTLSVRNPPPICVGIPHVVKFIEANACVEFYDLTVTKNLFYGCLRAYVAAFHFVHYSINIGCISMSRAAYVSITGSGSAWRSSLIKPLVAESSF